MMALRSMVLKVFAAPGSSRGAGVIGVRGVKGALMPYRTRAWKPGSIRWVDLALPGHRGPDGDDGHPWLQPPAEQHRRLVVRAGGADDKVRAGHRRRGRGRRGDGDARVGKLVGEPLPAVRARAVHARRRQVTDRGDGPQVLARLEPGAEHADGERPGAGQQVGGERGGGGGPVPGDRVPVDRLSAAAPPG